MDKNADLLSIPGYVSVREAAKLPGLLLRTIYNYVERGVLVNYVTNVIAISK